MRCSWTTSDDGLQVLAWLDAPEDTCAAYCLHPLLQGDDDLREHWQRAEPAQLLSAR